MLNEQHTSDCHDFVKLMFIKWSTGCCPVSHSSVTDHRRNRSRKVYYSQVMEEGHCEGLHGVIKAEYREKARPGAHSFIRVSG